MNRSKKFLLSIISITVFSCTTIASEKDPRNQLSLPITERVLRTIPGLGRYVQGEPAAAVIWDICNGAVNGAEAVRQGVNTLKNSPTTATITNAVTTGAHAGAEMLATNAHSAGVTLYTATQNLYNWAYAQRSTEHKEKQQPTFHETLTAFKTNMENITYIVDQADQKKCKDNIIENLTIIKQDISLITDLINQVKGTTTSGIRTTIIDYVLEQVTSEKNITEQEAQDYVNIIDDIAQFSKTEDGQNNFTESCLGNSSIESVISDGESLVSELEETENSVLHHNVFKKFIDQYMKNDSRMQTVLENKKQRTAAMELLKTDIKRWQNLVQNQSETIQQLMTELTLTIKALENAEQEKVELQTLANEQSATIGQLKQLEIEKAQSITDLENKANQQATATEQLLTQLEQRITQLQDKITSLKHYLGLTGLSVGALLLLFILHKTNMLEQFLDQLHIPSFSN